MAQFEGDLVWRKLEVYIALNGGLVIALGVIGTQDATDGAGPVLWPIIGIIGLTCSILWSVMNRRAWEKFDYWMEQARIECPKAPEVDPVRSMFEKEWTLGSQKVQTRSGPRKTFWSRVRELFSKDYWRRTRSISFVPIGLFALCYAILIALWTLKHWEVAR